MLNSLIYERGAKEEFGVGSGRGQTFELVASKNEILKTILITGATGNVGRAVIQYLHLAKGDFKLLAGVREIEKASLMLPSQAEPLPFDFEDQSSVKKAFSQSDILFLLRPPQLADVDKYFKPVITMAQEAHIEHIVFLSVQGAEKNTFIPHHKIEKLIKDSSLPYTFLRPAYFMQNFTTTLREDIVKNRQVFLPAGSAKFTLVDVDDIGRTAAQILKNSTKHSYKAYELTNQEQLTFQQMVTILSEELGKKITFISPNLFRFYWIKRREGVPTTLVFVIIMLHYLPRFQSTPPTTRWIEEITSEAPLTFRAFVRKNMAAFNAFQ